MKRLTRGLMAVAGFALLAPAVQAQNTVGDQNPGDVILGFNKSGSQDYVIDLGALTGSHVDFSAAINISTFNATFGGSAVGVNAGAVGGDIGLDPNIFVYTTTAHGVGAPTTPTSAGQIPAASSIVSGLGLGVQSSSAANAWTQIIAQNPTTGGANSQNNFVGQLSANANPLQTFGSSRVLVEDLWRDTNPANGTAAWQFLGTLTLDFSGASPLVTFDAVPVPEPSTYGLVAGAGLLLLSLRRQLKRGAA